MTHEEIKILISAYIDGEVNPSEKNIVEEHLKTCGSCQKDLVMYKAMSSSLSKWSDETLSPDEEIKVQKRFEQRRVPMFTQRTASLLTTTIALAIIIGSVVNLQLQHGLQVRKSSTNDIGDQLSSGSMMRQMAQSPVGIAPKSTYASAIEETKSIPFVNAAIVNGSMQAAAPVSSLKDNEAQLGTTADTFKKPIMGVPMPTMRPMMAREAKSGNIVFAGKETRLRVDADLSDNVTASVGLINERAWNSRPTTASYGDKRLEAGVAGADSSFEKQRMGYPVMEAQQAVYGYNSYYYPNNYWYYPQPYPVEPYRIQYAPSNTEQYDRIYDNPFLTAKENPLSTFSIDVDTGSYSNIRRFLLNGQKPPKDAVHIEELINYFNYDYPQPTGDDPFSITTEVSICPWNPQHQLALIGLQGKKIPMDNLPASNLVFLIDVSGSMGEQNKLPLVKSALHLLVEQLRPQDTVSIAVFAGSATNLLEAASGRDKDKIEDAIDNLEAGGSTNGEDGLQMAYRMAKENFIKNGNNRIIVTTDGDFNVGASDDADLVRMIEQKRDQGIYLSVFGFGMGNIKASRMEKLADAGHGNYDYIDSLNEARKEFEQQLTGTLYGIAKDVKIQVEFNPSTVKAYRLIGYEKRMLNKEDFNNDKKDAGVLGSGHTVTALYEITPADSRESFGNVDELRYQTTTVHSSDDLMTIKLRYKDPQSDTSKLIIRTLNKSQMSRKPSENLRFAGAVAEFGMLLRDSEYKGSSSYLQVMDTAQKSLGADVNGYRKDFLDLIEKGGLLDHTSNADETAQ